jgi:hypothetical protein
MMSSSNPLGSVSALSLAANPASLPVIAAAAGVAVTVAAATFTYRAYKHYEEKKMRDEITQINRLHEKYLERIFIPDNNEIKGFPAIFKYDPDKPEAGVDSMHFTDDQIEDIGKKIPRSTDIILTNYRQSVQNAILKLKDYYYSRDDRKDLTAGVICYLLYILDAKCLNFEGYEYDIAYLDAITNFINAYSSLGENENTRKFSRLAPVYSYLLNAQQDLERHRDSLCLEDMIGELRDTCINQTSQLMRCLTKLASRQEDWNLIPYVTMDELEKGILRRNYIKIGIKGIVLRSDAIVCLPDSIFKDWVSSLANYYIRTINPDTDMQSQDITSPDLLFKLPAFEKMESLQSNRFKLSSSEAEKLKKLEVEYKLTQKYFTTCKNFMTSILDDNKDNKIPKFVPIDNAVDIRIRSGMIAEFAKLIHQIISLQYMSVNLLKSIKQLGEIYVKSPANFRQVFNVFNILCKEIKTGIDDFKQSLIIIQQTNKNSMKLEDQELFPEQIKSILNVTYAKVSRLDRSIKEYRDRVPKEKNSPTTESVKHEMFEVAAKLSKCYRIAMDPEIDPASAELLTTETPSLPDIKSSVTISDLLNLLSKVNQNLKVIKSNLPNPTPAEKELHECLLLLRDNAAITLNNMQFPLGSNNLASLFTNLEDITSAMLNYSHLTKIDREATTKSFADYVTNHFMELKKCENYNGKISRVGMFGKRTEMEIKGLDVICKEMVLSTQPA